MLISVLIKTSKLFLSVGLSRICVLSIIWEEETAGVDIIMLY